MRQHRVYALGSTAQTAGEPQHLVGTPRAAPQARPASCPRRPTPTFTVAVCPC